MILLKLSLEKFVIYKYLYLYYREQQDMMAFVSLYNSHCGG